MGAPRAGIDARRQAASPRRSGALTAEEWIELVSGTVLLLSLLTLPWFAVSAGGIVSAGSEAGAFRWLDGIDVILLAVALLAAGPPLLRLADAAWRPPGDLAIVIAAGGVAAAALIAYRMIAPPEIDRELASAVSGAGVTVRGGALVGLVAAIGIAAGGIASLRGRSPAAKRSDSDLARATVDDLRALGLSTTQARRVVRYRDELGLVSTIADLDHVPGIPASLRAEVRAKLGD